MAPSNLYALRTAYPQQNLLLGYTGPLPQSQIEAFGVIVREHAQARGLPLTAVMDIFSVYIEMAQNTRHYITACDYQGDESHATLAISQDPQGRYVICCGNLVELEHGQQLVEHINKLSKLDRSQLKTAYKTRLHQDRNLATGVGVVASNGAGLGLLVIASKAHEPLGASLIALPEGRAFFSLRTTTI